MPSLREQIEMFVMANRAVFFSEGTLRLNAAAYMMCSAEWSNANPGPLLVGGPRPPGLIAGLQPTRESMDEMIMQETDKGTDFEAVATWECEFKKDIRVKSVFTKSIHVPPPLKAMRGPWDGADFPDYLARNGEIALTRSHVEGELAIVGTDAAVKDGPVLGVYKKREDAAILDWIEPVAV